MTKAAANYRARPLSRQNAKMGSRLLASQWRQP